MCRVTGPPSPAERVLVSSYRGLPVKCSAKQRPLAFDDLFPWSIQIDVTVLSVLQLSEARNLESPMVIWHCQKRPQPWSILGYFQISFHQDGNGRSFIRTMQVSSIYSRQPIPVLGGTRLQELPLPAEGAAPLRAAFIPMVSEAATPHRSMPWTDHAALQHHSEGWACRLFFSKSWCII